MAGQIAFNKPSGGQLILSPEDGTSTETVTIPSVGVGKVLQVSTDTTNTYVAGSSFTSWTTVWNIAPFTKVSPTSKIVIECDPSNLIEGSPAVGWRILNTTTNTVIAKSQSGTSGNGGWRMPLNTLVGTDTTAVTGANQYVLQFIGWGQTIYFNYWWDSYAGTETSAKIMEVAA